jgi:hypothetical protein
LTKPDIKNLEKRVDKIRESTPPPVSREDIIVAFIDQLPAELRNQIIAYGREQVKLEEDAN